MARKATKSEVSAGIIDEGNRDVNAVLEIPLDSLNDSELIFKGEIHDVAARLWMEAHLVADI